MRLVSFSPSVMANPHNEACISSPTVNLVASPLSATVSFSPSVMANTHNEACISSPTDLSISNSASSSVVNLTYLPNHIQELVSTIIALRFPRLRKRRLTYKRSCCGQYWHIIDLSFPPVYLPRARGAVLPPSPPSPPILLPLEGVVDVSRSSSRRVACQSPIRGHDPG